MLIKLKFNSLRTEVDGEIEPDDAHIIVHGVKGHHVYVIIRQLQFVIAANFNTQVRRPIVPRS